MMNIIDIKEIIDNKEPEFGKGFVSYFMQNDTWDFHIFRVLKGDYEGNQNVFTIEMENINKYDVIEQMGVELGGMDVREAFRYLDELDTAKAVVAVDVEKGFENWEYKVVQDLEEVMNLITQDDFYKVEKMIYEDTEVERDEDSQNLHLHYSLYESRDFLAKLLNDNRSKGYDNVLVSAYQNGREQGYVLTYQDKENGEKKSITFGQQRNSDDLIVYHGSVSETCISDDAYKNSKQFRNRHFNAASHYVFELLEKHANKTDSDSTFTVHKGLEVANSVLDLLMKDKRVENLQATVEGLQMGELNGYSVYFFDEKFNSQSLAFTNKDDDIALYIGRYQFQGLDKDSEEEIFKKEDIQNVVDKIFTYIQKYKRKTA